MSAYDFYSLERRGTAPYDSTFAVEPDAHLPGVHLVWMRATWTPRGDAPVVIDGRYLDAPQADGYPALGDGTMCLAEALGLKAEVDAMSNRSLTQVLLFINDQLAERPSAELRCPSGTLRIELCQRED